MLKTSPPISQRLVRKGALIEETYNLFKNWKDEKSFDQNFDQDEYERKIGLLIAGITADHHGHDEEAEEKWDAAVIKLSEGDHYIQVLLKFASSTRNGPLAAHGFIPTLNAPTIRPPHDRLKLWLTAFLVFLTLAGLAFLKAKLFGN